MTAKLEVLPEEGSFRWFGEGRHIVKMQNTGQDYVCFCDCGSRWTHGLESTLEKINAIYVAHVAYDHREPTKVL